MAIREVSEDRLGGLMEIFTKVRRDLDTEIQDHLRKGKDATPDKTQQGYDPSDSAGSDYHFSMAASKSVGLQKVEEALEHLKRGRPYGDCSVCGREISERRLRAVPFAIRCTDCEDVAEKSRGSDRRRHAGVSYLNVR